MELGGTSVRYGMTLLKGNLKDRYGSFYPGLKKHRFEGAENRTGGFTGSSNPAQRTCSSDLMPSNRLM